MRTGSTTRDLLGLVMTLGLAACGGLAAADMGASESNSPGAPSGSFEATCQSRGAECEWEITKCKGEPACARWYACVSACTVSSPEPCFEACLAKTHAPDNSASIEGCLLKGCPGGGGEPTGPLEGAGGAGGAAGASFGDASDKIVDSGNNGDNADATPVLAAMPWEGCVACLYNGSLSTSEGGTIQNCQTRCGESCNETTTAACVELCTARGVPQEKCQGVCTCSTMCGLAGHFKHVITNNAPGGVTGDLNGCLLPYPDAGTEDLWQQWEICLSDSPDNYGEWTPYQGLTLDLYILSGLHQCVMTQCSGVCLPPSTYQTCSECLQEHCPDQSYQYWTSPDAVEYGWCRDYCSDCDCATTYANGEAILTEFVKCRMQNCEAECPSSM